MSVKYRLYLDEQLIDDQFQARFERDAEFEISAQWLCTRNVDDADAFLLTEENLKKSAIADRAGIRPIICLNPQLLAAEFEINDLDYDVLLKQLTELQPIVDRVHHLKKEEVLESGNPYLMGLAFIWSRNKILKPRINSQLKGGVWYPYFDAHDFGGATGHETLTFLRNAGFLSTHVEEIAQSCPKCAGILVLLRDCCQNCGSVNIKEENIVHHFVCGYQAAESRFTVRNEELLSELWCPKCQKPLKHYGVDHDKPSVLFTCGDCGHENAETMVGGKCLTCQTSFPGDDSPRREIMAYEMTNPGIKALFDKEVNIFNLKQFLGQFMDVIPFDALLLVAQKISHIRDDIGTTILKLTLFTPDGETDTADDSKVMLEVGKNLSQHVRKSDAVALHRGSLYIMFVGAKHIEKNTLLGKEGIKTLLSDDVVSRLSAVQMSLKEFVDGYLGK